MRIKPDFILRRVADQCIVMPTGPNIKAFNGAIMLNETGAFLWEKLQEETTLEALVSALADAYEVTPEQATKDIEALLETVREAGLLVQETNA